jgi:hypothetical protein
MNLIAWEGNTMRVVCFPQCRFLEAGTVEPFMASITVDQDVTRVVRQVVNAVFWEFLLYGQRMEGRQMCRRTERSGFLLVTSRVCLQNNCSGSRTSPWSSFSLQCMTSALSSMVKASTMAMSLLAISSFWPWYGWRPPGRSSGRYIQYNRT